ncbi:unnamed protein product, partial [Pleuronectes platessa]
LPCTGDTWALADRMKKTRQTEAPAGSHWGRETVMAYWQRARRNPEAGDLVLSVALNAEEGPPPLPSCQGQKQAHQKRLIKPIQGSRETTEGTNNS